MLWNVEEWIRGQYSQEPWVFRNPARSINDVVECGLKRQTRIKKKRVGRFFLF